MDMELVRAQLAWWDNLREEFGDPTGEDIDAAILGAIIQVMGEESDDDEIDTRYLNSLNI